MVVGRRGQRAVGLVRPMCAAWRSCAGARALPRPTSSAPCRPRAFPESGGRSRLPRHKSGATWRRGKRQDLTLFVCFELIKFFVKHGLIGTAEPCPERHRHSYVQRFSYDEVHGHENSVSINKDYFFVHPALKECVRSQNQSLGPSFERLESGAIGDMLPFESKAPLIRLGVGPSGVFLDVREVGKLAIGRKNSTSDPLKFLFVALWACRINHRSSVSISDIRDWWSRLKQTDLLKSSLKVHLPSRDEDLTARIRDWAKKINGESGIRNLQLRISSLSVIDVGMKSPDSVHVRRSASFVSVTARSGIGAQSEVIFNQISIEDVDFERHLQAFLDRMGKPS